MKHFLLAIALNLVCYPTLAQTQLSPPALGWGGTGVQTPAPTQIIGYDLNTDAPCIVGSTSTCGLPLGPTTVAAVNPGVTQLNPPAFYWGGQGSTVAAPTQMIGYDSSTSLPCIIGSTATCAFPTLTSISGANGLVLYNSNGVATVTGSGITGLLIGSDNTAGLFGNRVVTLQVGGLGNNLLAEAYNNLPPSTNGLPVALIGYGHLSSTATGNQVFGVYGLGGLGNALAAPTAGVAVAAEFTARNYCGNPDTALPPNEAIGTPTCVANGLQVTSGGNYDSSIGILVGDEGGSTHNFNTAVWIHQYTQYGLVIENVIGASFNALFKGPIEINDPGTDTAALTILATSDTNGANLHMTGNGATTPGKTIRVISPGIFQVVNNAYNFVDLSITDAGVVGAGLTFTAPITTWADNQTCAAGQIVWDASFIYVCTATNTVKRATLASF